MGRIKEWEELTICDNFLFQKVMRNPRLCKRLIEKLLRIKVKRTHTRQQRKPSRPAPRRRASGLTSM